MQIRWRNALALIVLFSVFTVIELHSQTYSYKHYTVENGLNSSTVYWTLQDRDGFIWFGTDAGVARFDGTNFKQFTTGDGLSDDEVLKIFEDRKGRIWFLTFNGKLSYYLDGEFHNTKNDSVLKRAISDSHYHTFLEDSRGDLWFTTIRGDIIKIHDNTVSEIKANMETGRNNGWGAIYENSKKEISIVSAGRWYNNVRQNILAIEKEIRPYSIDMMFNVRPGEAYGLNENGIIKLNDNKSEMVIKQKGLNYTFVNQIYGDDKNFWISTRGKGCYFYKNYSTESEPEILLKNKVVCSAMQDKEGNIWLCTAGDGVFMLPANYASTRNYQVRDGLTSDNLYSVTRDEQGGIWVGLSDGTMNRIYNDKIISYDARYETTPYQRVLKIVADRDDNIWCVTDFTAYLFKHEKNDSYKKVSINNPNPSAFKTISEDKDGNMLLTYFLGVYRMTKERIANQDYQLDIISGIDSIRTYHAYTDHQGTVWSSTIRGLSRFDGKTLEYYSNGTDLENIRITNIREIDDSLLVLATDGYGVLFFRDGKVIFSVTKKDGLISNVCNSLFVRNNTIWVATSSGISKIELHNNYPSITSYTTASGLLSNEVRDIYDDDSLLYAATSKGLSIIDYNYKATSSPPPNVFFSSVLVDNRPVETINNFSLSHASKNITINFAAITFQFPERITYQYRLNNSETWTESKNHQVEFFSLDPGIYQFEVRAKKFNSSWSNASLISFEITPPYWKTWTFRLFLLMVVSAGVYLLFRQYLRRKIHEQLLFAEQQNEIEKERSRIASDMHDDLGSEITRISMLSRMIQDEETQEEHIKHHSKRIIQTSNDILQKMDEIIWALNSSNRKVDSLFSYINGYALDFFEGSNLACRLNITENLPEISMSAIQRRNIFLVVKESLNNIVKHAAATKVEITLEADANEILIKIEDNGHGFNNADLPHNRQGIKNMKKRVLEIKGDLEIISAAEKGTTVRISVPVTMSPV